VTQLKSDATNIETTPWLQSDMKGRRHEAIPAESQRDVRHLRPIEEARGAVQEVYEIALIEREVTSGGSVGRAAPRQGYRWPSSGRSLGCTGDGGVCHRFKVTLQRWADGCRPWVVCWVVGWEGLVAL